MKPFRPALGALAVVALTFAAACAPQVESSAPPPSDAAACAKESLALVKAGTFTVATDKPAYEPWFVDDDPANGKGYESAVAYAVAEKLGFSRDEVAWTVVPFTSA